MLLASHRGDGQSVGTPDVCNTPSASGTTPISYTNTSQNAQASGFSNIVKICSQNAVHLSTGITTTSGDEAGTAHGTIKGRQAFTSGNPVVLIEGQPAIHLSNSTAHNNYNCPSGTVTQPSTSVVYYTRRLHSLRASRCPPHEQWLDAAALATFHRTLAARAVTRMRQHKHGMRWWKLHHFGPSLPAELRMALGQIAHDPTPLLLDLRGNSGGCLQVALAAAGAFLGDGIYAGELCWNDGGVTPLCTSGRSCHQPPLTLWVDHLTASAAEHFAAVLQGSGRAEVVSDRPSSRTYGKASAHVLITHSYNGASYQHAAEVTVSGRSWRGCGIVPKVSTTAANFSSSASRG